MLPTSTPLEDQLRRQKTAVVRSFCEPKPYCDLCWRYTVRYAALTLAGFKIRSAPANLSPHYCEYHLPIENPPEHNCYRSDNRYREAFHEELSALVGRQRSKYVFRLQPPRNADIQEVRKAAYDTVHCGVRPLRSIHGSDESLAERVWRLYLAGSAQADIARRLSVHRQAVSRTLKRLKGIAAKQAIDAEIDPSTGEMFSLHSDATRSLFDTVRACRAEGASTAEIAQSIGRFKQTVKSVQRWLSVIDAIEAAQREGASLRTVAARYRLSIAFIASLASRFAREPERHEYEVARVHENEFRFGSLVPKSMPSRL
jgi:transposase